MYSMMAAEAKIIIAQTCTHSLRVSSVQMHQNQIEAQFNAIHVLAAMVKLKPDWLPTEIFDILYERWKSPARLAR